MFGMDYNMVNLKLDAAERCACWFWCCCRSNFEKGEPFTKDRFVYM